MSARSGAPLLQPHLKPWRWDSRTEVPLQSEIQSDSWFTYRVADWPRCAWDMHAK